MSEDVKAILLVGGRGTRLAPLTDYLPKPMLPVGGVPFTAHQILQARDAGVSEIILATSYKAELFEPYFGDGSKFGIKISYAHESEPLGTGGAIANAAQLLDCPADTPIVIFNGDVLSAHDLRGEIEYHRRRSAAVTLYLTEVEDARAFGVVPLDQDGWVLDFLEKMDQPISNLINAGCYIFNRGVIERIPLGEVVSVERQTFPSLLQAGVRVQGFVDKSYWRDIGTPNALIAASADLLMGKIKSPATVAANSLSGVGYISSSAEVDETAIVDQGSVILDGAKVGRDCEIIGSIVGEGAVIDASVTIRNAFVAPKSHITPDNCQGELLGF
jgi:mannose-1-phosphate guanylyltransferase